MSAANCAGVSVLVKVKAERPISKRGCRTTNRNAFVGGSIRRSKRTLRPFHSVGLDRVNEVTVQTSEFGAAIFGHDGFHSLFAVRA